MEGAHRGHYRGSLRERLAELWSEREAVRLHLASRIPAIQKQAECDIQNTLSDIRHPRPGLRAEARRGATMSTARKSR